MSKPLSIAESNDSKFAQEILNGDKKSKNCKVNITDFIGKQFGNLIILGEVKRKLVCSGFIRQIEVKCNCGVIFITSLYPVYSGKKVSCGCINKKIKHLHSYTKEYKTRSSFINRCTNPNDKNFKDYGGRGIKVCDKWLDKEKGFINFLNDMGYAPNKNYSIDRIDVNGDYCKENCRWATSKKQSNNKRNNVKYCYNEEYLTIPELSEKYNIKEELLQDRISRNGWEIDKAINTPIREPAKILHNGVYYTVKELSVILNVHYSTLYLRRQKGTTNSYKNLK